tara:strand:+ start:1175 stop:1327 length:153 start_codon:yes stop_codon:yes gene_type:complete
MLFTFNFFWKSLLSVAVSWVLYLSFGFELTIVTMLAILVASKLEDINFLV